MSKNTALATVCVVTPPAGILPQERFAPYQKIAPTISQGEDGNTLANAYGAGDNLFVSSRDTVIEFVSKLPSEMSLMEIAREVELLAGIQNAREQARRKEGVSAEDARKLVDSWASK